MDQIGVHANRGFIFSAVGRSSHSLVSLREPKSIPPAGQPQCIQERVCVLRKPRGSLRQFQDNALIASTYPNSPHTRLIETVRDLLQKCRGLKVLCDCVTPTSDSSMLTCHCTSVHAVGYCLVRGSTGKGSAYTHPSALDLAWSIKLGPLLITPDLSYPSYLPCLLTGVLSNCRWWCDAWAGELLTVAASMQVSLLSGYKGRTVLRATHSAVVWECPQGHKIAMKQ